MRTLGVEEELLLVDPGTGRAVAVAPTVLAEAAADDGTQTSTGASHRGGVHRDEDCAGEDHDDQGGGEGLEAELQLQQIEIDTSPCLRLGEVAEDLVRRRRHVDEMAQRAGARAVGLATSPLAVAPRTTPHPRYRRMASLYGLMEQEQLTCGCHVHVSVDSEEEGVAILDRVRVWLPVLVAMSTNSPFWQGGDTGYAGYRSQVWARWPSAGPVEVHGSPDRYHALVASLLATGAVLDQGMVYFDARLSASYPTVEVRVADVAQDVRHTVLVAGLVRGLVDTAAAEWRDGRSAPDVPAALLRAANWTASRHGLGDQLVHPATGQQVSATRVVADLMEHVTPALAANDDLEAVGALVDRLLGSGTGADEQRRVHARRDRLDDVVRAAIEATHRGSDGLQGE